MSLFGIDDSQNRDRRTLVISWKSGVIPALQALGQDVTCVVAASDVTAARASGFTGLLVSVRDPGSVEDVLSGLLRNEIDLESFWAVGSNIESSVVAASVLGQLINARCIDLQSSILLRDKIAQKQAVREAGIPVADHFSVDSLADVSGMETRYPVVVKPIAGAGTADTHLVRSADAADRLARDIGPTAAHGPWAVEEFVDGPELAVNGVVRDGRLIMLSVSRYLQNLLAIKKGGAVGTVLLNEPGNEQLYARARSLTSQALAALGHTDGVFHLEAFDQGDRLVFGECAGRTGGGMLQEMIQRKFGVDLVGEWARALLDVPAQIPAQPADGRCYGMANLSCVPGRITAVPTAAQLAALDGVVEAQVSVRVGDTAPDATTASNLRVGRFVVAADSEDSVSKTLQTVIAWFRTQTSVAPGDPADE